MAQLDEGVRHDVKLLQITGNKSLERLLELVEDKLSGGNPLLAVVTNAVKLSVGESARLDKIKSLIDKLALKFDALSTIRFTCYL